MELISRSMRVEKCSALYIAFYLIYTWTVLDQVDVCNVRHLKSISDIMLFCLIIGH